MSNMLHKGGLPELFSEVGFSQVKYFEGTISSTATTIDLNPPCKRVVIRNTSSTIPVYVRVDGDVAVETTVVFTPGARQVALINSTATGSGGTLNYIISYKFPDQLGNISMSQSWGSTEDDGIVVIPVRSV